MPKQIFTNNASSVLTTAIDTVATTIVISDGSMFPLPTGGDYFLMALIGVNVNGQEASWEIVKCTTRSSNTLTVVRAQESTVAASWGIGIRAEVRVTADFANTTTLHMDSVANPHSVTKTQVGLGNVDNTSNATERAATATLTNKTLTTPTLTNPSYSGTTANGGTVTTIDINGGTIDGTPIGSTTPNTGAFTTLSATGSTTLASTSGSGSIVVIGGSPINDQVALVKLISSTFARNWQISSNNYIGSNLEFTPSTAGGGSTFTTPVMTLSTAGAAITGTLSATGAIKSTGANLVNEASAIKISQEGVSASSITAYGVNSGTQGALSIVTKSSDGTASAIPAVFSSAGAAITGTLSATGTFTSNTTSDNIALQNGSGVAIGKVFNDAGYLNLQATGNVTALRTEHTIRMQGRINGATITETTSTGLAVTGVSSASGMQVTGNSTNSTGSGAEILGGATAVLQGYNRTGGAYINTVVDGLTVALKVSGTTTGLFSGTGLAVTGAGSISTDLQVGGAVNIARISAQGGSGIGISYIENTTGSTNRIQLGAEASLGYINATAGSGSPSLGFKVNGTTQATLDATGNFGLGVTPSAGAGHREFDIGASGQNYGSLSQKLGNDCAVVVGWNAYGGSNTVGVSSGYKYKVSSDLASLYAQAAGTHYWLTAPSGTAGNAITFTQAMTLNASGDLLVGRTTNALNNTVGIGALYSGSLFAESTSPQFYANRLTTDGTSIAFRRQNVDVGSISVTGSATAYNTSSDYRLKNITGPVTNSGAYIDSLNPVQGTWKADGSTFVGLLAHEVQEASRTPVATGTKDGAEMQAMDYSSSEIIANLIAELQSVRQRLAQLEGI